MVYRNLENITRREHICVYCEYVGRDNKDAIEHIWSRNSINHINMTELEYLF